MRHEIVLAPQAVSDVERLRAVDRSALRAAMETHLRFEPEKTSRSRIKKLRGLRRPQFRLRVGELRVFYDVRGDVVEVLAVVNKSDASAWLKREGTPE